MFTGAPPSLEVVTALAKRERVPLRIAKGELEGKMKCRIWRKLHAEEAKRFDQAYSLVATNSELSLADAFGIIQSGLTVEEFRGRRDRSQKRTQVKTARQGVTGEAVQRLFQQWREEKRELCVLLGERTLVDILEGEQPVSLKLERSGRLQKLKVVLIAARPLWEEFAPGLERDSRLVQRPPPVPREPERRPFADPRPFTPFVGKRIALTLRNGLQLNEQLTAIGPFDLVLRSSEPAQALLIPLHAVISWAEA